MFKNKIKNEVINYIKENTNIDNNSYFSDVVGSNDIEYNNYGSFSSDYDSKLYPKEISVSWEININQTNNPTNRQLTISIARLEGFFVIGLYDKQAQTLVSNNLKDINDIRWFFDVNTRNYKFGEPLFIKSLNFDVDSKVCEVVF